MSLSFREEIKMSTPSELETVTVKCFPGKLQLNEMEMLGGVFAIGEEFTGEENGTQSYLLYEHIGLPKKQNGCVLTHVDAGKRERERDRKSYNERGVRMGESERI